LWRSNLVSPDIVKGIVDLFIESKNIEMSKTRVFNELLAAHRLKDHNSMSNLKRRVYETFDVMARHGIIVECSDQDSSEGWAKVKTPYRLASTASLYQQLREFLKSQSEIEHARIASGMPSDADLPQKTNRPRHLNGDSRKDRRIKLVLEETAKRLKQHGI